MPLAEAHIVQRMTELMELDGMAGTHIRVLSNLRSFYVSKYITRFQAVHPRIPLPNWIVTLAAPGDLRPSDTELVVTNMGPDLDGDTNSPPSPQQGNIISNEQEAMDGGWSDSHWVNWS
jgi:hypothetical protein